MMKKRFIASVEDFTDENVKVFAEYLKCHQCRWWHWLTNLWLITAHSDEITPKSIAKKIHEINQNQNNIVFEITAKKNWHGYGPTSESTYFTWIQENWPE